MEDQPSEEVVVQSKKSRRRNAKTKGTKLFSEALTGIEPDENLAQSEEEENVDETPISSSKKIGKRSRLTEDDDEGSDKRQRHSTVHFSSAQVKTLLMPPRRENMEDVLSYTETMMQAHNKWDAYLQLFEVSENQPSSSWC